MAAAQGLFSSLRHCVSVRLAQTALVSCLFEQNFPQHSVTESMALRESLGTGANPYPGVHQAWIANFCPGAEHSCAKAVREQLFHAKGLCPVSSLVHAFLPSYHGSLVRCILGTAGEIGLSSRQAQSGMGLAPSQSSCHAVRASLLALGCSIPVT